MGSRSRRIRVLVADDSRTALSAVCRYLELDGRFEIVGTAIDGIRLLHQVQRFMPDLVLTDLSMPQMNGLEAVKELRKTFPELRVLIFTGLCGASLREECLKHGAHGFVSKSQMPESLLQAVSNLFPRTPGQAEGK
ncbi:MAG TPA: response regulator transcription factor [Candidatus Angelobacter sp.]|nr:response regulator transcription factor [Candidatus Angelobacter sp.]